MKTLFHAMLCSVLIIAATGVGAQPVANDPAVREAIGILDAWIETQTAYRQVPGLTIGIVHDQELVWAKGYGFADPERKIPATPSTVFRIASISKLFTSIAIMRLRDEGKLRLDDPVSAYLPWFDIRQAFPDSPPITIEHLLTHTSGLPREAPFPYWTDFEFPTRGQIREGLGEQETVFPPSMRWKYSNLALSLAGEIVAAVSGVPYGDYIRTTILDPLGMTGTGVTPDGALGERLAVGYGRRMPDGSREVRPFTDSKGLTPAANLSSTVEDFAKFASWQFRLLDTGKREILTAHTLREMHRVHWVHREWESGWGLGFAVWHSEERDLVGHGGHVAGYTTRIALSPEEKIAVFVMTSADDGDPGYYVERAFEVVAPEIVAAAAPPEKAARFPDEWRKYIGAYADSWSDYRVLPYRGGLTMIFPEAEDPLESRWTLVPAGENAFRIEGSGYGSIGELVVFELDAAGKVKRLKIGENFAYPAHE